MNNINICVSGCKTDDFTAHLGIIRKIGGLKVLKRRNKPFYDITGAVATEQDFKQMEQELSYLLTYCEAEIEINDPALRALVFPNV